MNYREKILDINFLINEGWSIVEVSMDDDKGSSFFQTNDFEPPSIGSVQSAPYLHFKGVDITDFIQKSGFNQSNPEIYRQRFRQFVEDGNNKVSFKFSDKHLWRYYNK